MNNLNEDSVQPHIGSSLFFFIFYFFLTDHTSMSALLDKPHLEGLTGSEFPHGNMKREILFAYPPAMAPTWFTFMINGLPLQTLSL